MIQIRLDAFLEINQMNKLTDIVIYTIIDAEKLQKVSSTFVFISTFIEKKSEIYQD